MTRGFERGMSEARSILDGLGAPDPELGPSVDRTEGLVREGLAQFFSAERERLFR